MRCSVHSCAHRYHRHMASRIGLVAVLGVGLFSMAARVLDPPMFFMSVRRPLAWVLQLVSSTGSSLPRSPPARAFAAEASWCRQEGCVRAKLAGSPDCHAVSLPSGTCWTWDCLFAARRVSGCEKCDACGLVLAMCLYTFMLIAQCWGWKLCRRCPSPKPTRVHLYC